MKKITFFVALACITTLGFSQTQRMELYEEFSGENSTPSANVNPGLNTLLQGNTSKIAAITYETNLPTNPPFNSLYRQDRRDINNRMTYYNVLFAPYARFSGKVIRNPLDTTQNGNAGLLTQNIIDTAYLVNSPFTIALSHSFHPAYDSVVITMVITATQAFTATGTLSAQIAMEEAAIHLSAPTGTNGEKDFYNVCRKMVPAATFNTPPGTALPTTWTNGQTQTLTITTAVPGYIFDNSQICFVGYIQDDGNLRVQQAATSAPVAIVNDASSTALTGIPFLMCGSNFFTPSITLINRGTSTLTSCKINRQLDALTPAFTNWTGSIAPGASLVVVLPAVTTTAGTHTYTVWPSLPNGTADVNTNGDTQVANFTIDGTAAAAPLMEPFAANAPSFPPAGWIVENPDNDNVAWGQSNSQGAVAPGSARLRFSRDVAGRVDLLYTVNTNLSAAATATLQFNMFHLQYKNLNDSLVIEASNDCGNTWVAAWAKGGARLSTGPNDTTNSTPSSGIGAWQRVVVDLGAFVTDPSVIVRFKAISGAGNDLYIDAVNLSNSPLGIKENSLLSSLNIYPNPFSNNTNIVFELAQSADVKLNVTNVLGQTVYSSAQGTLPAGQNTLSLNAASLSEGMYFINVTTSGYTISRKVTITK
jgi:hypothetical protein